MAEIREFIVEFTDQIAIEKFERIHGTSGEIIRCKDCKHNSLKRVTGNAFCDLGIGLSQIYDFCSLGERRESDA